MDPEPEALHQEEDPRRVDFTEVLLQAELREEHHHLEADRPEDTPEAQHRLMENHSQNHHLLTDPKRPVQQDFDHQVLLRLKGRAPAVEAHILQEAQRRIAESG